MYIFTTQKRCIVLGRYLVDNHATVRSVANKFGISKSTVHKDITQQLKKIDYELYLKVKSVLDKNKNERHIRGGEATKNKYKKATGI